MRTQGDWYKTGEKIHEEMITSSDSFFTYDLGKYYAILPQSPMFNLNDFISHFKALKVHEGFNYSSGENTQWETVASIKNLIKNNSNNIFI